MLVEKNITITELRAERDWLRSEWEAMARERDELRAALKQIASAHLDGERRFSWAQGVAAEALDRDKCRKRD